MTPLRIEVILNAGSGNGGTLALRERLATVFSEGGAEARIKLAENGQALTRLAQSAAEGDAQVVVAGGGDGTVNAVASALLGTGKALGILPLGTLNHFAKDLGLPLDPAKAARAILTGRPVQVDVGEVNGKIFLNNSGLGLYPSIVRVREKKQRRGRDKWVAFTQAAVEVLRRYPFLDVRLYAGGKEFRSRTPLVLVGNNEYVVEGLMLGRRACLNAGCLSLYVTHSVGRLGLARLALRAVFGGLREAEEFVSLCTSEIWVETHRRRLPVSTDGEVSVFETPLHFRVLPRALSVVVPAQPPAQQSAHSGG